jgi:hypothetical protein
MAYKRYSKGNRSYPCPYSKAQRKAFAEMRVAEFLDKNERPSEKKKERPCYENEAGFIDPVKFRAWENGELK